MTHPRSTLAAAAVVLLLAVPAWTHARAAAPAGADRAAPSAAPSPASPEGEASPAAAAPPAGNEPPSLAGPLGLPSASLSPAAWSLVPLAAPLPVFFSSAALLAAAGAAGHDAVASPAGIEPPASLAAPLAVSLSSTAPLAAPGAAAHEAVPSSAADEPSPAEVSPPPASSFAAPASEPSVARAAEAPAATAAPGDAASEHRERSAPPAGSPDAEALARVYRRTGTAPSVERATESLFPFGHVRPVLRCAPLRACAVELEAGELVLATSLGDSERWLLQAASSGPGARTPILVVKPTACDLSTNLVVSTDRRIYELALDSPPCRNADSGEATYNPHLQYTGVARFYYPDDLVRRWTGQEELAREQAERQAAGRTPLAAGARLAHLNFDYAWDRAHRWPWVPAQVFDDGEHTYIALPPGARLAEMPLLFALGPHGELALLNYQLDGQTLVADRVLERAALVVGSAKKKDEQRLEILNRAFGANAGANARRP
jgi:type IV secretion system protein TrbG